MVDAGAEFMDPGHKEPREFNAVCGYLLHHTRWAGCPAATPDVRDRWLSSIHQRNCSAPSPALLNANPQDAVLPGLPALLSGIYGRASPQLAFVLLLREPLQRMQSLWYMWRLLGDFTAILTGSFQEYLTSLEPLVRRYKAEGFEGIALDPRAYGAYSSLYGMTIDAWLPHFRSRQFVLVPMTFYFGAASHRDLVLQHLATKFGLGLSPRRLGARQRHLREDSHPPIAKDVDNATAQLWYDEFFRPDIRLLANLVAESMPKGLDLMGYSGTANPGASTMFDYLCGTLPCLL